MQKLYAEAVAAVIALARSGVADAETKAQTLADAHARRVEDDESRRRLIGEKADAERDVKRFEREAADAESKLNAARAVGGGLTRTEDGMMRGGADHVVKVALLVLAGIGATGVYNTEALQATSFFETSGILALEFEYASTIAGYSLPLFGFFALHCYFFAGRPEIAKARREWLVGRGWWAMGAAYLAFGGSYVVYARAEDGVDPTALPMWAVTIVMLASASVIFVCSEITVRELYGGLYVVRLSAEAREALIAELAAARDVVYEALKGAARRFRESEDAIDGMDAERQRAAGLVMAEFWGEVARIERAETALEHDLTKRRSDARVKIFDPDTEQEAVGEAGVA